MASRKQRKKIREIWYEMAHHSSQMGYFEERPMKLTSLTFEQFLTKLREGVHFVSDCSETASAVCKWAGLKSPSGPAYKYDGYGNSESILTYLKHYFNARMAGVGALVHFQNPDHIAQVVQTSRIRGNPLLAEHGAPGIAIVPLSVERRYHNGPVTFLSINKL